MSALAIKRETPQRLVDGQPLPARNLRQLTNTDRREGPHPTYGHGSRTDGDLDHTRVRSRLPGVLTGADPLCTYRRSRIRRGGLASQRSGVDIVSRRASACGTLGAAGRAGSPARAHSAGPGAGAGERAGSRSGIIVVVDETTFSFAAADGSDIAVHGRACRAVRRLAEALTARATSRSPDRPNHRNRDRRGDRGMT